MDSLCRLHDGRISSLEKQLKEFKNVNDFLVTKVAAQAKQISALYLKPPQLPWRINDVENILSQAREKRSTVLESSLFYSANHGYKLKLYVYPNGDIFVGNIVMELTTDPTLSSCAKLAAGKVVKPSIGFARFVTHKNLKTRGYIVNDSLLLQVEVHPPN